MFTSPSRFATLDHSAQAAVRGNRTAKLYGPAGPPGPWTPSSSWTGRSSQRHLSRVCLLPPRWKVLPGKLSMIGMLTEFARRVATPAVAREECEGSTTSKPMLVPSGGKPSLSPIGRRKHGADDNPVGIGDAARQVGVINAVGRRPARRVIDRQVCARNQFLRPTAKEELVQPTAVCQRPDGGWANRPPRRCHGRLCPKP